MDRRQLLRFFGVGIGAGLSAGRSAPASPPAPLAVRIVPTRNTEQLGPAFELYLPEQHFHVVISNASGGPIRLWREWCSWGYFNLAFVVTDEGGRAVTVKKANRSWRKNYPDAMIVPPGGHMVLEVTFDPATWPDAPLPERHRSKAVRMRAVYTSRPDKDATEHGVWTGEVSSGEESYTIWR